MTDFLNRIICGDNTEVLSGFPSECIDLVVTSPPYDNLRSYGSKSPFNFDVLCRELVRVLKPGGIIVWVVADETVEGGETGTSMTQALMFKQRGLRIHDTMIYEKAASGAVGSSLSYWQEWEYMFVFSKGRPKTVNRLKRKAMHPGQKHTSGAKQSGIKSRVINGTVTTGNECLRGNVWRYAVGTTAGDKTDHPAPMPIALAKDHILSWSNPGDIVLDPFSGSGTTCKAAKELNRQWCGIEINPEYCKIAETRLMQEVLQLA